MRRVGRRQWVALGILFSAGCVALDEFNPLVNCDAPAQPDLVVLLDSDSYVRARVPGVDDAEWLAVRRADGTGLVGGYVTPDAGPRRSLVVLLSGAGTISKGGRVETALRFYREYGGRFRALGFALWAPVLSEADPYASGEVDDLVMMVDWLNAEGRGLLGVDRVYLVGYSTGATTAVFANDRCDVTAVVAIAPLTGPAQLVRSAAVYRRLADAFPCNSGFQQMRRTIDAYESAGWEGFDAAARVPQMRNPVLFMQASDDFVYVVSNTQDVETAYREALAAGRVVPEMTFVYPEHAGHFAYVLDPRWFEPVLAYLERFEP